MAAAGQVCRPELTRRFGDGVVGRGGGRQLMTLGLSSGFNPLRNTSPPRAQVGAQFLQIERTRPAISAISSCILLHVLAEAGQLFLDTLSQFSTWSRVVSYN